MAMIEMAMIEINTHIGKFLCIKKKVVPVPHATFPPGFHFKNPLKYGSLRPLQDSKPWLQPINKD